MGKALAAALGALLALAPWASALTRVPPWRPLAQPEIDAATLYLLDASRERRLAPGAGGLISSWASGVPASASPFNHAVRVGTGRFRPGLTNVGLPHPGYAWMPAEGMISSRQFTIELWLRSDLPWAALPPEAPLAVSDASGASRLLLRIGAGQLGIELDQAQLPGAPTMTSLSRRVSVPARRWTEVAVTFAGGRLRLYLDGRQIAARRGVRAPAVWSDTSVRDGLSLLGSPSTGPTSHISISDLRISRIARAPGRASPLPQATVSVDAAHPTGMSVSSGLTGVLHTLGPASGVIDGAVTVIRTDKLLTVTPIKRGAPDATHPTPGLSGQFSYDWEVVDRSLRYITSVGALPYVSIDATPSILGGSVAPYSGPQLTSGFAYQSDYPPQVPNDLSAFAAMARDLVYHVVVEDHLPVRLWGVWNEPDYGAFWRGSVQQYVALYAAVAGAVKSVSPSLLVGGPEVSNVENPFLMTFLRAVRAQRLPLDFVSFHAYTGSIGDLLRARASIGRTLGRVPPLVVGEWLGNGYQRPGNGQLEPWSGLDYFGNDWAAAVDATSMIEMQRIGTQIAIYSQASSPASGPPYGLATASEPLAPLNVFRLWDMLGPELLPVAGDPGAGVTIQASRDSQGRVYVLMAHLRYRPDLSARVTVAIRGVPSSAPVRRYEIDGRHSDYVDAGASHAQLETVPAPALRNGRIVVTLPARAVTLLVVGA